MAYELPVIKAVLYDNIHWITNAMERTASKQYFGKSGNGARCAISKALNLSDVCKLIFNLCHMKELCESELRVVP